MNNNSFFAKWQAATPYFHAILRIVSALMFITFGIMKLFAWPVGMPPNNATAELTSLAGIAGILELVGGFLMTIGLWTRPVAFILSGEMAVAYFHGHWPVSPWPVVNYGAAAVLYCFVFLYFSAAGAGPWSVDALRNRR